jgi:hypothetical protein
MVESRLGSRTLYPRLARGFRQSGGSGTGSPVLLTADVTLNRLEVAVGTGYIVAPDLGDR